MEQSMNNQTSIALALDRSQIVGGIPDPQSLLHAMIELLRRVSGGTQEEQQDETITKILEICAQIIPDNHTDKAMTLSNMDTMPVRLSDKRISFEGVEKTMRLLKQAEHHGVEITLDNRPTWLHRLGLAYGAVFKHSKAQQDIDRSIELMVQSLSLTGEYSANQPPFLFNLGQGYWLRFESFNQRTDLEKAFKCFESGIDLSEGNPNSKIRGTLMWLELATSLRSPSVLTAASRFIALVPQALWLGSTDENKYKTIRSRIHNLAVDTVSLAIASRDYSVAIVWLEFGSAVVWNQLHRTPLEKLQEMSPSLATELKSASLELEIESLSPDDANSSLLFKSGAGNGHFPQPQQHAAKDWEELVKQAWDVMDLKHFLLPKSSDELVLAAHSSTLIMVNMDESMGCDVLAVLQGSTNIVHISLPSFSYTKMSNVLSQIHGSLRRAGVSARKVYRQHQADERQNLNKRFMGVLEMLWEDLARPVLSQLGFVNTAPDKSSLPRITWRTTGRLTFLPLHAAGRYREPVERIFDYVISSYTPTLATLLQMDYGECTPVSIQPMVSSSVCDGILAVGQTSGLPGIAEEIGCLEAQLVGLPFVRIEGERATPHAVLEAMERASWVHFACHASQNANDPKQSAFQLHGGALTLAAIADKSLRRGRFAFLSACETAMGDQNLPDESVHLAAGMIMAGFSTVIGTMWSIEDRDAPLVADEVYKHLLKYGRLDAANAAEALHAAVARLRVEVGEGDFVRWVPYIHMGQ